MESEGYAENAENRMQRLCREWGVKRTWETESAEHGEWERRECREQKKNDNGNGGTLSVLKSVEKQ